jgi:3-hydroxyisobutyryl-CoA hydrolase
MENNTNKDNKDDSIIFKHHNDYVLEVQFNQPKKLNALDKNALLRLSKHILKYLPDDIKEAENIKEEHVKVPNVIVFNGNGNAFCAGTDVKEIYALLLDNKIDDVVSFNEAELAMDYSLTLMKPIQVAIWNGYVMGSGAGLSVNAPIRIASDNTVFAMPETAIGYYPDVGAAYFLPKLLGSYELALYVGLIGYRISGKEAVQCGIATHYVRPENIEALKLAIISQVDSTTNLLKLKEIIRPFVDFEYDSNLFCFNNLELIKKAFYLDNIRNIYERLENMRTNGNEELFASETLSQLDKMSPMMMVIFLEFVRRARDFGSIKQAYEMEAKLFQKVVRETNEFREGIRAALIEKDKCPKWEFPSLKDVNEYDINERFF